MRTAWQGLRQWRFPPEFRIAPAAWPVDLLAELQRVVNQPPIAPEAPAAAPTAEPPTTQPWDEQALASTVTSLWRAHRKAESVDGAGPVRQVRRHLQAAWDSLDHLGVKVLDHDNEPFHSGLALEALAIQPHPGVSRETVIETVRPTIYLNEQFIQMGQVIVGTPDEDKDS